MVKAYIKEDNCAISLIESDVESAIREYICACHPEFRTGYIINPLFPMGTCFPIIFSAVKSEEQKPNQGA